MVDLTLVQPYNSDSNRTKFCRDCGFVTRYTRKTYYIGRLIYAADECQECGDRSNISKVDPKTLREVDSDGR